MAELSAETQTALSYLEDVKAKTDHLERMDNQYTRQSAGYELINGDLHLARQEAYSAPQDERGFLLGTSYLREGLIKVAMARGWREFLVLPEGKQAYRRFMAEAGEAFSQAVREDPQPEYYYNLGLTFAALGRNYDAVQAFEEAKKGGDTQTAIDARKEIGRIGPVSPPAPGTTAAGGSVATASFGPQKVPNWIIVRNGAIALVAGLLLSGILIGIPIAVVGLAMIIYGFVVTVDKY